MISVLQHAYDFKIEIQLRTRITGSVAFPCAHARYRDDMSCETGSGPVYPVHHHPRYSFLGLHETRSGLQYSLRRRSDGNIPDLNSTDLDHKCIVQIPYYLVAVE